MPRKYPLDRESKSEGEQLCRDSQEPIKRPLIESGGILPDREGLP